MLSFGEGKAYSYRTGENENMGVAIGCIVVVKIDGCGRWM